MADVEQIPSTLVAYVSEEYLSTAEASLYPTIQGSNKKKYLKNVATVHSQQCLKSKQSLQQKNPSFPLWKKSWSPVSQNALAKHYYLDSSYL